MDDCESNHSLFLSETLGIRGCEFQTRALLHDATAPDVQRKRKRNRELNDDGRKAVKSGDGGARVVYLSDRFARRSPGGGGGLQTPLRVTLWRQRQRKTELRHEDVQRQQTHQDADGRVDDVLEVLQLLVVLILRLLNVAQRSQVSK